MQSTDLHCLMPLSLALCGSWALDVTRPNCVVIAKHTLDSKDEYPLSPLQKLQSISSTFLYRLYVDMIIVQILKLTSSVSFHFFLMWLLEHLKFHRQLALVFPTIKRCWSRPTLFYYKGRNRGRGA